MFYGRCFWCLCCLFDRRIHYRPSLHENTECFNCFGYAVRPCLSWRSGRVGGLFSLKGLGAGFLILLIMYFIGAVGAGDVKLFGALVPGPAYGLPCRALCILSFCRCHRFAYPALASGNDEANTYCRWQYRRRFVMKSWLPWRNSQEEHLRFPFMIAVLPGVISTYVVLHL